MFKRLSLAVCTFSVLVSCGDAPESEYVLKNEQTPKSLVGYYCTIKDSVRNLEFLTKTEVRDVTSFGPHKRKYELKDDKLTIHLFSGGFENYDVVGKNLVPAKKPGSATKTFNCKKK